MKHVSTVFKSVRLTTSSAPAAVAVVVFGLVISTLVSACLIFYSPEAGAQYNRNLPKAGFGNYGGSSVGASNLPRVQGVHLTDGLEEPGNGGKLQPYNPGEPTLNWQIVRWETK